MTQETVSRNSHKGQNQKAYTEKYNGHVSCCEVQKQLHDELFNRIAAVIENGRQMKEFITELKTMMTHSSNGGELLKQPGRLHHCDEK